MTWDGWQHLTAKLTAEQLDGTGQHQTAGDE